MNKLFQLLNLFSNHTKKDLKIFLTMSGNRLPDLDKKIIKELLEHKKEGFIWNKYFKSIVGEKKAKKTWARTKHRLGEVLENFIVFQKIKNHPIRKIILLNFYAEQNLSSLKKRLLKSKKKTLSTNNNLYEYLTADFIVSDRDKVRVVSESFEIMERKLDDFYLEKKLRCLCEKGNRKEIINTSLKSEQLILDWIENQMQNCDSININIYYSCYRMISLRDDQFYNETKSFIFENIIRFNDEIITEVIHYLLNYCTQSVNKGKPGFAQDYLMLIDQLENKNLLLNHGNISAVKFKNCINIALIADKIEWAKAFCQKYNCFIQKEYKMSVLSLGQATIAFHETNYDDCINILDQQEFKDPYHRLAYNLLSLKVNCVRVLRGGFDLYSFTSQVKSRKDFIRKQDWIKDNRKIKLQYLLSLLPKIARGNVNNLNIQKDKLYALDWIWINQFLK